MGRLPVISLYTGAGGLDLGLHAAGFQSTVAVEMNPVAVRTLRANPGYWGAILAEDIHDLLEMGKDGRPSAHRILNAGELKRGQAALLAAGPPCQPFSKSGYWARGDSMRLYDPRARTLDAFLDVLESTLPQAYLLENVPGISFSEKDEGLEYLKRRIQAINRRNTDANYSFKAAKLNAAEYGVPQLRERVFVIGHREGKRFRLPRPTHALPLRVDMSQGAAPDLGGWQVPLGLEPALTAWDAIGHLPPPEDPELASRGKWAPVLPSIPEGANYLWHTRRGGSGLHLWGWRTRWWSMLLKLAKNRPSWTLTATPGPAIGPFHWESRRLSAEELCALQTFPPGYQIKGSSRAAHLQLGNAVPSAVSEILGWMIRHQFLDGVELSHAPTLLSRRSASIPAPELYLPAESLPDHIRALHGVYEDHPGTGLGPGARKREEVAAVPTGSR